MSSRPRLHMSVSEEPEDDRYDEPEEGDGHGPDPDARFDDEIPRRETLHRIAYTVLFAIIAGTIRALLGLIVIFELLFTLITRRPPGLRVRNFANRIASYYYRVIRYLTYNESRVPFPFDDFPEPLEPDSFSPDDRDSEVLER